MAPVETAALTEDQACDVARCAIERSRRSMHAAQGAGRGRRAALVDPCMHAASAFSALVSKRPLVKQAPNVG